MIFCLTNKNDMKKIIDFLNRWGVIIIISLLVIIAFKDCSNGKKMKKYNKSQTEAVSEVNRKVDSLASVQVTDVDLRIEGLKTEKRMIQSCDRKRFDLDRENQIDRELSELEKSGKKNK